MQSSRLTQKVRGEGAAFPSLSARHQVARLWAYRERIEHEAADQFGRLAQGLVEAGSDPRLTELARVAADDESRHAVLCRELAREFDPAMVFDEPELGVALGPEGLGPKSRVLYAAVALGCVTETLSTALLIEMRNVATHPGVRSTIHSILEDEITHSRIGWAHLAFEARRSNVRWVSRYLAPMIAEAVGGEKKPLPSLVAEDFSGFGILSRGRAQSVMMQALREVVLPGLAGFGIVPGVVA